MVASMRSYQQEVEGPGGTYPVTRAYLRLLVAYLERGFANGVIATHVMYCLHELLPSHHQWHYRAADVRWEVSALLLKVRGL